VVPGGIEEISMKGLGRVAQDRVLRACKVTKEKGRAREGVLGRKEIEQSTEVAGSSVEPGLVSLEKASSRCKRIDDIPQVVPGWGCCQCHAYNNYERKVCKNCGHVPCYPSLKGVLDEES
jgi:hypothetical protein